MIERDFGRTGLRVSALGLGAGQIGQDVVTPAHAARVIDAALDAGITLIDTARGYGTSEEHLGRLLGPRRERIVLSTKGGYGVDGVDDWTPEAVRRGIDESLARLRTDRLDIYHLHSCPMTPTLRDDLIAVLHAARDAGKVRVPAYSGDNDDLIAAIASHGFGSIETSVNIADQWSLHHAVMDAGALGLGVIAKRPAANNVWRHDQRPVGVYGETYWERLRELSYEVDLAADEFALRFAAFAPGVSSAIAGTADPEHVRHNAEMVAKGPLPADVLAHVERRWQERGADWPGEV